ncbi:MAG TPA: hypothetical protein VIN10_05275 [Bacteroidales bacterium]
MNKLLIILFTILTGIIYGQVPKTMIEYELKRKNYSWTPDSTIIFDSVCLFPFDKTEFIDNTKIATIKINGYKQSYRIDLMTNPNFKTGIVTSYTYAIKNERKTKEEKAYFENMKIKNKMVWRLQTKQMSLPSKLLDSLFNFISNIELESLPAEKTFYKSIGIQVDGAVYEIIKSDSETNTSYKIGSVYIDKSNELKRISQIKEFIESNIINNEDYNVSYKNDGTIYNGGSSAMFVYKIE